MSMRLQRLFERVDPAIAGWMWGWGHLLLRGSLAVIFIWFGILKPLGVSEAEPLIAATVYWAVDPDWFVPVLGWWEVLIGVCLLARPLIRVALLLLAMQMVGTFLPLVLVPEATWQGFAQPTIEGQYVIKNLVIISAAVVVGGTVGGVRGRERERRV